MKAWLTPSSLPSGVEGVCVQLPVGAEWRAALRGAILLLADPASWEPYGDVTPDEAASVFMDVLDSLLQNWPCEEP